MKREMAKIEAEENILKEAIEELIRERNISKDKCDRIKHNIKLNRQKYNKSVEEFGRDNELD